MKTTVASAIMTRVMPNGMTAVTWTNGVASHSLKDATRIVEAAVAAGLTVSLWESDVGPRHCYVVVLSEPSGASCAASASRAG